MKRGRLNWLFKRRPVEIRRTRLEPGDVLVLRYTGRLSGEEYQWIEKAISAEFPEQKCLVLEDGTRLEILHPVNGAAASSPNGTQGDACATGGSPTASSQTSDPSKGTR